MDEAGHGIDEEILGEVGRRLAHARVELELTQQQLAAAAGVGKRTVERLEQGQSVQLGHYLRVLRALGLLDAWLAVHPDARPGPMARLKETQRAPRRRRVRGRRAPQPEAGAEKPWQWGDEK